MAIRNFDNLAQGEGGLLELGLGGLLGFNAEGFYGGIVKPDDGGGS